MNLSSLIKKTANAYPEKTAIIEDGEEISYKHLWQEIESLSNALRSIGIRKNTRVALILPNCKEFIYSFFALLTINAIAIPLKPQMTCWEFHGIFKNGNPKALILTSHLLNKILTEKPSLLKNRIIIVKEEKQDIRIMDKDGHLENLPLYTLSTLLEMGKGEGTRTRRIQTPSQQVASINYTYRGYGYPLGAMLTHHNYIHGAIRYIKLVRIQPDMRILLLLPVSHIFPLTGCVLVPLLAKATVVISTAINPKKVFQTIEKNKVNVLVCVPTLYEFLVKHYDHTKWDISSLLFGISGAESLPMDLYNNIRSKMGIDVIQGYGLTETLPVTCNPRFGNKPETIGIRGHDVKLKIVDKENRECKTDETGEIIVKCPSVMLGYYKAPKETMDVIQNGWFYTGDYGMMDNEGYVYFKGLKKSIAKIDGITVDLNEIKNVLSLKNKVIIHCVYPIELVEKSGQKMKKGIVVLFSTKDNIDCSYISNFLLPRLIHYKFPKKFIKIK